MKLNIQLFASGTVDNFTKVKGTSSATLQGKIDWSSVGDVANNQSTVTTILWVRRTDNYTSSPTYGKDWKGTVKVGSNTEHKFTGFSSSVSVGSSWVKLATYTDVIKHNADGTCNITISGSVTGPSGTSLASATSRGSKTVELDKLHKVPDNVQYTITEKNQKLINAGIGNNVFVKDLSIKSFNISGTTYDGTTIKEYAIFNRLNAFSSQTLPLILDLSKYELETDTTYVTKIPIKAQIIDSFDTAGYSETNLYNYIQYSKINLTETSTTVKRNGQTSGKVKLNIVGNLFNGVVGNVNQSSYKPTIKYKFWKANATEPSSYSYTIPATNISVAGNEFKVSNYEIGTTTETATNHFNPDYAYKVKIYVEDNFTSYSSQEKSIPVGEATWTEYKDRVDFKKATIKGTEVATLTNVNILKEVVLYNNESGSNTTITLSETCANFKYLEIFCKATDNTYTSVKVYKPDGKRATVVGGWFGTASYFKNAVLNISADKISFGGFANTQITGTNKCSTANDTTAMYIVRVVGYRN